ncbi:MAG: hypothetical protein IPL90_12025 [Holophagales bacterium]|nr:hypothetical protein [Holophagales bacterium]
MRFATGAGTVATDCAAGTGCSTIDDATGGTNGAANGFGASTAAATGTKAGNCTWTGAGAHAGAGGSWAYRGAISLASCGPGTDRGWPVTIAVRPSIPDSATRRNEEWLSAIARW